MLDKFQDQQGHIEGDWPGQATPAVYIFSVLLPMKKHKFLKGLPVEGAMELQQGMIEIDKDRNQLCFVLWHSGKGSRRMIIGSHGMLLDDDFWNSHLGSYRRERSFSIANGVEKPLFSATRSS